MSPSNFDVHLYRTRTGAWGFRVDYARGPRLTSFPFPTRRRALTAASILLDLLFQDEEGGAPEL